MLLTKQAARQSVWEHNPAQRGIVLTMPIEMVARAKGSPMMWPKLKFRAPPKPFLLPSILRSEGDRSEPYGGMKLEVEVGVRPKSVSGLFAERVQDVFG